MSSAPFPAAVPCCRDMLSPAAMSTRPARGPGGSGLPGRIAAAFGIWRQRRRLARLDAAALHDIGVTRAAAQAEAARPVWDVPGHWRG